MKLAFWKQWKKEESASGRGTSHSGPKIRVLMVDDEAAFTRMTRRHLEAAGGFEVETVSQARAALGAARAFKPDVILLDVMMPDGDGGEVAAALGQEDDLSHIPIMFLTAAIKGNEVGKKGAGFIGGRLYIAKPVEPNMLIGLLAGARTRKLAMCNHAPKEKKGAPVSHAKPPLPVLGLLFQNIAFWQGMGFVMLICVVWVNAILDLPNLLYGRPPSEMDWTGASILTAGIVVIGFITVGHTYLLQQHILKGIIIVCSYCNKVKLEESQWERMERYLAGKTLAKFSHGVCPDCYDVIQADYALDGADSAPSEPELRTKTVV